MTREELVMQAAALPLADRLEVIRELRKSCMRDRLDCSPEKAAGYIRTMCGIMGRDITTGRTYPNTWCRYMIGYRLTQEGYGCGVAARAIGLNHATVLYGNGQIRQALSHPRCYADINGIWNKFIDAIGNGNIHKSTDADPVQV